ncbi:Tho complex subunit 7-domain-containing protein [Entophlyctis helioformis]|nr:Tho complex subunit 7-domain-containing protein [Entophlyctis helioformis]
MELLSPQAAAQLEAMVIRNRVLNEPLSKQLQATIKRFAILAEKPADSDRLKLAYERVMTDLASLQVTMFKQQLVLDMADREAIYFTEERQRIEAEIQESQAGIVQLKEDLVQAEIRKQNRMEYDAIAKEIVKVESREETEKNIKDVLEEIEQLHAEKQSIAAAKQMRVKYFASIVATMQELQTVLQESGNGDDVMFIPAADEGKGSAAAATEEADEEEGAIDDVMDTS